MDIFILHCFNTCQKSRGWTHSSFSASTHARSQEDWDIHPIILDINTEIKRMEGFIVLILEINTEVKRIETFFPHPRHQHRGQEDGGIHSPHPRHQHRGQEDGGIHSPHPRHQHRGQEDGGIHPPHPRHQHRGQEVQSPEEISENEAPESTFYKYMYRKEMEGTPYVRTNSIILLSGKMFAEFSLTFSLYVSPSFCTVWKWKETL